MVIIILLVIVVALVAYAVSIYNGLVTAKNGYKNAFAQIDVQLTRRHDLIPNLVEVAKGYLAHERGTLEEVIQARNAAVSGLAAAKANPGDPAAMQNLSASENSLTQGLGRLFALSEAYPDLKANTTFLEFQGALQKVEDELQLARRYYNGAARNLNVAVESFPSVVIANAFKFEKVEYFELENEADRAVPQVKF